MRYSINVDLLMRGFVNLVMSLFEKH